MEEIRRITSSKQDLRKFGLALGVILVVFGLVSRGSDRDGQIALWLGVLFLAIALVLPSVLKPLQKALAVAGITTAWIITRVILILVFYLVVTPIGLALRWSGKRPLDLGFSNSESRKSFWSYRKPQESASSQLERQF